MCILTATNKIQGITKFRDLLCVSMSLFASHKLGYTSQVVSYIHLCRRSFPTFDGCFPAKCPPPLPWRVRKPPTESQRRWSRLVKALTAPASAEAPMMLWWDLCASTHRSLHTHLVLRFTFQWSAWNITNRLLIKTKMKSYATQI